MNWKKFEEFFEPEWGVKLKPFIESKECNEIYAYLKERSKDGHVIIPDSRDTYKSFIATPYLGLNVVFLFPDPYPWVKNGEMIANGIALDSSNSLISQPALDLFYEGIEDDLYKGLNLNWIKDRSVNYLCEQGIMMLNSSLTVEENKPGSHFEIWKPFMKYLFEKIFSEVNSGLIFILCGKQPQFYEKFINPLQHYIIKVEHPGTAALKGKKWDHQNLFKKINRILLDNNNIQIDWCNEKHAEVYDDSDLPF